jgi:N-acetylmuramic acid 6-phosphate etherase
MVNVQPKNSKLLDRARRIVSSATGASYDDAALMLEQAENNVRAAIAKWEKSNNG